MDSIDKMTEHAGELLFEASGQNPPTARGTIKKLAHHLGRLYGEAIRACRGYDGLQDEVTTTFMCGMALEPNFGREEEPAGDGQHDDTARVQAMFDKGTPLPTGTYRIKGTLRLPSDSFGITVTDAKGDEEAEQEEVPDIEARAGADGLTHWHVKTSGATGTKAAAALDTALREGTLGEEKSPGQLLFEKGYGPPARPWGKLPDNSRRAFEKEAAIRAMPAVGAIRITEGEMRDPRAEEMEKIWLPAMRKLGEAHRESLKELHRQCQEEVKARELEAAAAAPGKSMTLAKSCWKCHGSGDMGFTTHVPCDAC